MSISSPQRVLISRVTHDQFGRPVQSPRNFSNENLDPFQVDANLKDNYYSKEMNKVFGVADLVAWSETLTGALLWWYVPSPATVINELTTLGELGQVQVGRMHRLDEERSDGAMAWLQVLAGAGGLTSCIADLISHKERESVDLSTNQKMSLSIASFFNAVAMFFGAGEKTLIATTTTENGKRSNSMDINGKSDARCSVEWFAMSLMPWFSKFEPFKKVLDYLITYLALREGISHFVRKGVSMVFNNTVKKLPKALEKVLRVVFLVSGKDAKTIIWPFNKKWFFGAESDKNSKGETEPGTQGFRAKLMRILKGFGCKPPECYFDKDENIVSEFYDRPKLDEEELKSADENLVSVRQDLDTVRQESNVMKPELAQG